MTKDLQQLAAQAPARCRMMAVLLAGALGAAIGAQAQTMTKWEFHPGNGLKRITEPSGSRTGGGPQPFIFKYAVFPNEGDAGWVAATVDGKGQVNWTGKSIHEKKDDYKVVNFTYFRTFLDLPQNYDASKPAIVKVGSVDDLAQFHIRNSKHKNGVNVLGPDQKGFRGAATVDIKEFLAPGRNTILLVQADDGCCSSTLKGDITVTLGSAPVSVTGAGATGSAPIQVTFKSPSNYTDYKIMDESTNKLLTTVVRRKDPKGPDTIQTISATGNTVIKVMMGSRSLGSFKVGDKANGKSVVNVYFFPSFAGIPNVKKLPPADVCGTTAGLSDGSLWTGYSESKAISVFCEAVRMNFTN